MISRTLDRDGLSLVGSLDQVHAVQQTRRRCALATRRAEIDTVRGPRGRQRDEHTGRWRGERRDRRRQQRRLGRGVARTAPAGHRGRRRGRRVHRLTLAAPADTRRPLIEPPGQTLWLARARTARAPGGAAPAGARDSSASSTLSPVAVAVAVLRCPCLMAMASTSGPSSAGGYDGLSRPANRPGSSLRAPGTSVSIASFGRTWCGRTAGRPATAPFGSPRQAHGRRAPPRRGPRGRSPAAVRLRARAGPARLDDDRRRVDDRLRHLHRLGRHRPRTSGSAGWLLVAWVVTGLLTVAAALSYGELAAMMPQAGGQYVYLREAYSPLWGFLYGWTLFLVIQTGTIAAVAVAFARFLGVLVPAISPTAWIVAPIDLSDELRAQPLARSSSSAILLIVFLTWLNTRGLQLGKLDPEHLHLGEDAVAARADRARHLRRARTPTRSRPTSPTLWTPRDAVTIRPDLRSVPAALGGRAALLGLLVAFCVAQVGSLFSSDAWNNITFTAGEVKDPRRNVPLSLACGTGLVIALYVLANVAYLVHAAARRRSRTRPTTASATAALQRDLRRRPAPAIMAVAIIISTFGCNNGLILAGARVYYAMARDGLFFRATGHAQRAPRAGARRSSLQCVWACAARAAAHPVDAAGRRARRRERPAYGNLYGNLLDYVVFAVLIFYVLTIAGPLRAAAQAPGRRAPVPRLRLPGGAGALHRWPPRRSCWCSSLYKTETTWPGLLIVLTGIPVYLVWRRSACPPRRQADGRTLSRALGPVASDASPSRRIHGKSTVRQEAARAAARGDEGREPAAPRPRPGRSSPAWASARSSAPASSSRPARPRTTSPARR